MGWFIPIILASGAGYLGWNLREDVVGNEDNGGIIDSTITEPIQEVNTGLRWGFYIVVGLIILNIIGVFK